MRMVLIVIVLAALVGLLCMVGWVMATSLTEYVRNRQALRDHRAAQRRCAEENRRLEERQRWQDFAAFHRQQARDAEAAGDMSLAWLATENAERLEELARRLDS